MKESVNRKVCLIVVGLMVQILLLFVCVDVEKMLILHPIFLTLWTIINVLVVIAVWKEIDLDDKYLDGYK